eukprot:Clim_evm18s134 gene=Clim_evmTU18s134
MTHRVRYFGPLTALFVVLCCLVVGTKALSFPLRSGDQKCFLEEVPVDTEVRGTYRVELWDEEAKRFVFDEDNGAVHLEAESPGGEVLVKKDFFGEGKFLFTSHDNGEHIICLSMGNAGFFGRSAKMRVFFNIETGEDTVNYEEIAREERLSQLQLRVRQLMGQADQIIKEQHYQRFRETRFRSISESTLDRVFWWSIIQLVILLGVGFWQTRHLTGFFKQKKLV